MFHLTANAGALIGARAVAAQTLWLLLLPLIAVGQTQKPQVAGVEVVDKMVAIINGHELITYTDLLWQLALEPNTPIDSPHSADLNRALDRLIDQRLVGEEGEKLPAINPKDEEIEAALAALVRRFPAQSEFQQRVSKVGLTVGQLREIVRQRVVIEKYLDFRFRSFTVVTAQEVADNYRDVYVPRHRQRTPGRIVPKLEAARAEIERTLTEAKIESDISAFLEDARAHAEITILSPL